MRIEPVIAVNALDTIGPTRIRVHTASSAKLPVVITTQGRRCRRLLRLRHRGAPNRSHQPTSTATIEDALRGDAPRRWAAATGTQITGTEPGTPAVDNGRLIGIVAKPRNKASQPNRTRGPATPPPRMTSPDPEAFSGTEPPHARAANTNSTTRSAAPSSPPGQESQHPDDRKNL